VQHACCAECGRATDGELFLYPTEKALAGVETSRICAECFSFKGEDRIVITRALPGSPTESPDETFGALFKAARVLLSERIEGEDKIIPTLRLAQRMGRAAPRMLYSIVRVVQVVKGIPILERVGVTASAHRNFATNTLADFVISLWPRAEKVAAKEIADSTRRL
jgi:hypothetical protein